MDRLRSFAAPAYGRLAQDDTSWGTSWRETYRGDPLGGNLVGEAGDTMYTNALYELRCRECGKTWGNAPRSFCEDCFSPLEVAYDYDSLKKIARRENLASRAFNMWRYAELLPLP